MLSPVFAAYLRPLPHSQQRNSLEQATSDCALPRVAHRQSWRTSLATSRSVLFYTPERQVLMSLGWMTFDVVLACGPPLSISEHVHVAQLRVDVLN